MEQNKENYFPKVELEGCKFEESCYEIGRYRYNATSLYNHAKKLKLKAFKFPLASFDLSEYNTSMKDMILRQFAEHAKRVMDANTDIPIIFDDSGQLADGYHRVIKAICEGKGYLMAYRLPSMPNYDFLYNE